MGGRTVTDELGKERTESHARKRAARWVMLALAALVVLGWGSWFIWLVRVELETERQLHRSHDGLSVTWERANEQRITPVHDILDQIVADSSMKITVEAPAEQAAEKMRSEEAESQSRTKSSGSFTALFRRVFASPDRDTYGIVQYGGTAFEALEFVVPNVFGPNAIWYIEGDHIVITTADNVPRFDASAKARQWWHALEAWWEGGP